MSETARGLFPLIGLAALRGALAIAVAVAAGEARAQDRAQRISIVYGFGPIGKLDKSFNESAYRGVLAAEREHGVDITEFEPQTAREQSTFVDEATASSDLTIGVGWGIGEDARRAAEANPDRRITLIDFVTDLPNVQTVAFREEEGSYLVGVLAALTSRSKVVGFVGGRDLPLVHRFRIGFEAGVASVNPDIQVPWRMTGDTHKAFSDPVEGMRIAEEMIGRDADILFAAAGATGLGVYQAAKNAGIYAIGVDSNQNYLYPGTMLTSMIKRVDRAVAITVTRFLEGAWRPGVTVLGLKEGGVDYAVDQFNGHLIGENSRARLRAAREAIVSGQVDVRSLVAGLSN